MADGAGKAIPILPAGRLDTSMAFYEAIGFTVTSEHEDYALVVRGRVELHLVDSPGHDPLSTAGMAYVRVPDVDAWYERVRAAGVPTRRWTAEELRARWDRGEPIARMTRVEDKPWGLREFALLDADNNLVRIGEPLADRRQPGCSGDRRAVAGASTGRAGALGRHGGQTDQGGGLQQDGGDQRR